MKRGRSLILLLAGIVIISFQNSTHLVKPAPPNEEATIYYYNENGEEIGTTKGTVSTSYVIKTSKRKEDIYTPAEIAGIKNFLPADVHNISKKIADSVEWLIRHGRTKVQLVKDNVEEILPKHIIQSMRATIKDDGGGGNFEQNNKEYGGLVLNNNTVDSLQEGNVKDVCDTIKLDFVVKLLAGFKAEFHSHPSGCIGDLLLYPCSSEYDAARSGQCFYAQGPSRKDQEEVGKLIRKRKGYVFGMRSRKIYIYDKRGVLAILDFAFLQSPPPH